ncbi:MAG: hypothetical protein KDC44_24055, partial [Phaeodactylibacter sp.]|nr:hypothetical protein [Phaeodactylibacter sp.]
LTVNGQNISNFQFGNQRLTATISLKQGVNTVQVRGSNDAGSDQASVQITYRPSTPPTVEIQTPADNSKVTDPMVSLTARTTNVSNKNEVKLYLNNQLIDFSFSNDLVKDSFRINKGSNKIRISVNNADGSDQDEVAINLIPTVPTVKRPIVRFKNPPKPGQEVSTERGRITAEVLHVEGKESIELRLNGKVVKDFTYDPKTKLLNLTTTWIKGENSIVIFANNDAGQERAATDIIYTPSTPVGPKPKITLINLSQPTINPFNPSVGTTTLALSIKNVKQKDQITFTINGVPFEDFTFNPRTGRLDAQLVLQRGDNTLRIEATNQNGSSTFTKEVNF